MPSFKSAYLFHVGLILSMLRNFSGVGKIFNMRLSVLVLLYVCIFCKEPLNKGYIFLVRETSLYRQTGKYYKKFKLTGTSNKSRVTCK